MYRASCIDCPYGGYKVGSRGPIDSPIVIIGSGCSPIELANKKPFIGPQTELLDKMFEHSDLTTVLKNQNVEPLYLHAIKCFANDKTTTNKKVKNKKGITKVIEGGKAKYKRALQTCYHSLIEVIEEYPRKLIIVMGVGALHSITNDFKLKITNERGNLIPSELAELGIFVITSPEFIMRGGGSLQQYKSDFKKIADLYQKSSTQTFVQFKEPKGITLNSDLAVNSLIKELKCHGLKEGLVAADIETSGFDHFKDEILEIGISLNGTDVLVIPKEYIHPDLFDNDCQWVWHNGKFDLKFLWKLGCHKARVHHDTMLISYAMNEIGGVHDLEQVGWDWLRAPRYKDMLKPYLPNKETSYAEIPDDIRREYASLDVGVTWQLVEPMLKELKKDKGNYINYTRVLIPGTQYLAKVEWNGFLVNKEWTQQVYEEMYTEQEALSKAFQEYAIEVTGKEVNTNSPQQLQNFLYRDLGLGHPAMDTSKDTLERLVGNEAVDILLKMRKLSKGISTYVRPLVEKTDEENRIHATYKLHGTKTGRLASSGPNMQNIPRLPKIRNMFQAREGYILIECDLSQAELRSLAQLANDIELIRIYNSNELSLHDEVTAELFPDYTNPDVSHVDKKEMKMRGKCVNFGIVYGRQAPSFAAEFNTSIPEAQRWINKWLDRFPQAKEYIANCRKAVSRGQNLRTIFGRKRRFGVVIPERRKKLENEASNFPHQSTASDITLLAGIELEPTLDQVFNAKVVNTVHDCIVIECLPIYKDVICRLVTSTLERIPADWGLTKVPFQSTAESGTQWGTLHEEEDYLKCNLKTLHENIGVCLETGTEYQHLKNRELMLNKPLSSVIES